MKTDKPYVVYQSKGKQTQLLFMDLLLVVFSLSLWYLGQHGAHISYLAAGVSGTLLFGWWGLFLLRRLFKGKVLLQLTPEGFYDHSTWWAASGHLIRWTDVEALHEVLIGNQMFVGVELTNETEYLASLPAYKRLLGQANGKIVHSPLNINLKTARFVTSHEVVAVMEKYRQNSRKLV